MGTRRPQGHGGRTDVVFSAASRPSDPFVPLLLPLDGASVTECTVAAPAARPQVDSLRACHRGARSRVARDRLLQSWRSLEAARAVVESSVVIPAEAQMAQTHWSPDLPVKTPPSAILVSLHIM